MHTLSPYDAHTSQQCCSCNSGPEGCMQESVFLRWIAGLWYYSKQCACLTLLKRVR